MYFGALDPDSVRIELYSDTVDARAALRQPMVRGDHLAGAANGYLYSGETPDERPADHFTVRAVPQHADAVVPLEAGQILWQR